MNYLETEDVVNPLSSGISDRSVMMVIVQPLYQLISRSGEEDSDHQFDVERQERVNNSKNCTKVDCINSYCGNSVLDYVAEFFRVLGLLVLVTFLLTFFIFGYQLYDRNTPVSSPSSYELLSTSPTTPINIALFGDSLVGQTFTNFQFAENMQHDLNEYSINWYNYGVDNDTIERIAKRVSNALFHNPKIVLLLFDSDCSDYTIEMSDDEEEMTQIKYQTNLADVITRLLNHTSVEHVLVAGPGLLGEGPFLLKSRFQGKTSMLNTYRILNEEVINQFSASQVEYVDIRTVLQHALPWYWALSWGYVTIDGEHYNALGSKIIAKEFTQKFKQYLSSSS